MLALVPTSLHIIVSNNTYADTDTSVMGEYQLILSAHQPLLRDISDSLAFKGTAVFTS